MNAYRGDFDKTKHMSFLIKDENIVKLGKMSAALPIKNLTVNRYLI